MDCPSFFCNRKLIFMNNDIFPCLWFDGNGKEAADFYTTLFDGKIDVDTPMVLNLDLFGQRVMILNAGPQFVKNASISFMVICHSKEEIHTYWDAMLDDGIALMPLDSYPWSELYGWIRDKYGVTWQFYFGETPENAQRFVPNLMFMHENNGKAKAAMEFYTQIFPNSEIGGVLEYKNGGENNGEPGDHVQHADFNLSSYTFFCMDSSINHPFDFNEAISIVKMTDNQTETDYLWNALTADGGRESMCGWLKDKYGVSWQIVPKKLIELMNDVDHPEKVNKVIQAMMGMQKIDIAKIEAAHQEG